MEAGKEKPSRKASLVCPSQIPEIPIDESSADFGFGDVDQVLSSAFQSASNLRGLMRKTRYREGNIRRVEGSRSEDV